MIGVGKKKPGNKAPLHSRKAMVLAACLAAWLLGASAVLARQSPPEPTPTVDRLAAPAMPAEPTQADLGALTYYYICMACHGDRGQGLTDEFRSLWAPGDQNCWQAKCHGPNHPPYGFELVRYVPPVVGEDALARHLNAQQLYSYISTQMPWQAPGTLSEDEYWQLTAFLMRANGVDIEGKVLGPEVEVAVPDSEAEIDATPGLSQVPPIAMPPHGDSPGAAVWAALIALFIAAALALVWMIRRRRSVS